MHRAVVSIGVKEDRRLPELQAAVDSARCLPRGRRSSRVQTRRLITDAKGQVSRDRIFDTVEKFTQLGFIEQLIVYFSGHGINIGLEERGSCRARPTTRRRRWISSRAAQSAPVLRNPDTSCSSRMPAGPRPTASRRRALPERRSSDFPTLIRPRALQSICSSPRSSVTARSR